MTALACQEQGCATPCADFGALSRHLIEDHLIAAHVAIPRARRGSVTDLRATLTAERDRLARELATPLDESERIDVGDDDSAVVVMHRDALMADRGRKVARIKALDAALARISAGTFGVCPECGKEISSARLRVLPTARLCLKCQERSERYEARARLMEDREP